jgi:predicted HicB family RNase H-like nuclease
MENRTKSILYVRVGPAMHDILMAKAIKARMTLSAYVRRILVRHAARGRGAK